MKKDRNQKKRFIEAARKHGASEDPKAFERLFKAIVPPKKEGDVAERKSAAKDRKS